MIRTLKPAESNLKKRIVKSPKVFIRDSGLLHSLLGITDFDQLMGHPVQGNSWEGFAIEHCIVAGGRMEAIVLPDTGWSRYGSGT